MKALLPHILAAATLLVPVTRLAAQEATPAPTASAAPETGLISPEKATEIKRYLSLSRMLTMQKDAMPDVPAAFWDELGKDVKSETPNLIARLLPIFDKHFTVEDFKGINAFYETPVGQRMAEKQPLIMKDSMAAGQEWGMALGAKLQAKLAGKDAKAPATEEKKPAPAPRTRKAKSTD
jgi:uncharacterized protein